MTRNSILILLSLILTISVFGQISNPTLTNDAKFRKTDNPLSDIIKIIPAGKQVKVLSKSGGYYKVNYNGRIGYINELYFESKPSSYSSSNSSSSSLTWNKSKLKEHWKTYKPDKIEGIYIKTRKIVSYNGFGQPKTYPNIVSEANFFIVNDGNDGNEYVMMSFSDDFYGTIRKTVGSNKYFLTTNLKYWGLDSERKTLSMYLNSTNELVLEDVIYEKNLRTSGVNYTNKAVFSDTYSMVYQPEIFEKPKTKSSGTGFSISSTGLIATNHHVIEGGKTIKVRGINNDFSKAYNAKLVIADKNNDLAIIKIDDYSFTSLGTIPYTIKTSGSNVGEDIFVLGYPLRATMGDEVKLTNGIISSKTGFQGDVISYQISAPVQPGNSGGPLFDNNGQLIGIINAKHSGAENASYAVKSSYLTNLIDLLDYPPTLQRISNVKGKSLTQQVQILKKFVYIIEVN